MTFDGKLQHFIEYIKLISTAHRDVDISLQQMTEWRNEFAHALNSITFDVNGLAQHSDLFQEIHFLNQQTQTHIQDWEQQWHRLSQNHSMADAFSDQVMLLIFGKFNAGKSSLCNLLAECFRLQGQPVKYFYLQDNQIFYTETRLREGATETTAQLQGVCLGEKLVLLDTPGLHSVTLENAALTQKFIDSADGVLWLTSSTSPGQVQELDSLARELKRYKPLLPVITRSDQIEEDEVDGEICTVLCNKNTTQRRLQESDVFIRAADKLREMQVDVALLKQPVSLSTQMVSTAGITQQALSEAGFEHFFATLLEMIEPALRYKQRKPAEVFLHYLQEHVLDDFTSHIEILFDLVESRLNQATSAFAQQQVHLAEEVWRSVVPELPRLLDLHANTQAVDCLTETLNQWLQKSFTEKMQQRLADYRVEMNQTIQINIPHKIGYERIADIIVYDQLYAELSRQIDSHVKEYALDMIQQCEATLNKITHSLQHFKNIIKTYQTRLDVLASDLRQYESE